ncbi:GNAT family N-acetyltransferase [Chelativorans sp. M5D2P16]|uniref:GNAT family N-acetyltransferase n=1 Tax=Chelativorans sp. M5D2P16 TaxID=3095678 RepID=UPI002ACA55A8|nr:GNAT family N-acetyltransferase [Chelativorans sp. M5D2P16]MDZ5697000.1 GNAT family N-acetyltransferase [Chelativorans sp. M5D2P16]
MKIVIRRYRTGDEAQVSDLWSRASKAAHPFIPGEGEGERLRLLRDVYLVHAENWVATDADGNVVGLLGLLSTHEDAEVGGLFIAPEAQGKGIGRQLIAHAVALKGDLRLEVFARNEGARHFYRRTGFEEDGSRTDPDTGFELILLRRKRTSAPN